MTRALDEPIPDIERLYRAVDPDHVEGDRLLFPAIDLMGSSVNRSKYDAVARAVLSPLRPRESVVARMVGTSLKKHVSVSGINYRMFLQDDPTDTNDAHAEIRVVRDDGSTYEYERKPKSATTKSTLRSMIASAFRIHLEDQI